MSRIYIAYRSIDSHQKAIHKIHETLVDTYGTDYVTLSPQESSLDTTIRQQLVTAHDVLIVIFGRYGLSMVDERGNRILDDPYDTQHIDISAGLKHRLQVHTLVFDDMVENLADHLPEVLDGLAKQSIKLHVTNANLSEHLDTLISDIGDRKPTPPTTKPDISKMVIQPSPKHTQPITPSSQPEQSAEPEIYIHQSRNPVLRLVRNFAGRLFTNADPARQGEQNTHPVTGRTRVDSYRQMWPTSFLVIAAVIALSVFVAAMMQTTSPETTSTAYGLDQVATMGRGAIDVAFSTDSTEVAHITSYGYVYHYDWETMDFPDRVNVRMTSPEQVEYSTNDRIILRNQSRIFVINTREYGGFIEHQYVTDSLIVDMAVSSVSPDIVFLSSDGLLSHWNYETGQITESQSQSTVRTVYPYDDVVVCVSVELNQVAVLSRGELRVFAMDTMDALYSDRVRGYNYIAFDEEKERLIGWYGSDRANFLRTDNWSPRLITLSHYDPDLDKRHMQSDKLAYDATYDRLVQVTDKKVIEWLFSWQPQYLSEYRLADANDTIQSIAISPNGKYLVTGTLSDTVVWALDTDT